MCDILVIVANRPDTALHDAQEKPCLLIDIALPVDSDFNTKETEKLSKYKDLEIEASNLWKLRTKTVSVTAGALGTVRRVR